MKNILFALFIGLVGGVAIAYADANNWIQVNTTSIPYTGATSSVNLGSQALTTTGTISAASGSTFAAKTAAAAIFNNTSTVINSTDLGGLDLRGYDRNLALRAGPYAHGKGRGVWSTSSHPSAFLIEIIPTGSTSRVPSVYADQTGNVGLGYNASSTAPTNTVVVSDRTPSTGATQLLVQGGAIAGDATTNTLLRVNAGGGTTQVFSVTGAGNVMVAAGTNIVYYCNAGASAGNMCRGNACSCVAGTWVDTGLRIP